MKILLLLPGLSSNLPNGNHAYFYKHTFLFSFLNTITNCHWNRHVICMPAVTMPPPRLSYPLVLLTIQFKQIEYDLFYWDFSASVNSVAGTSALDTIYSPRSVVGWALQKPSRRVTSCRKPAWIHCTDLVPKGAYTVVIRTKPLRSYVRITRSDFGVLQVSTNRTARHYTMQVQIPFRARKAPISTP